ncbi:MAG: orotate phosphoribosyltransferase [Thermoanaerobaculia bacterium]
MRGGDEQAIVRRLLEESGALGRGHFRLSSGRHSASYVQCALLLEEPARAARVGELLAERLRELAPQSVLSPALGGVVVGHAVAAALAVPFRFCERRDGAMKLRRGFSLRPGERVVVIEDVITTGGSAGEAAALAETAGAEVLAIGAIILRGEPSALSTLPEGLLELDLASWDAAECPLCAAGEPLTAPGSRPSTE